MSDPSKRFSIFLFCEERDSLRVCRSKFGVDRFLCFALSVVSTLAVVLLFDFNVVRELDDLATYNFNSQEGTIFLSSRNEP